MKKRNVVFLTVLALLLLVAPFHGQYIDDGGTITWHSAFDLWRVDLHHTLWTQDDTHGYATGTTVYLLNHEIWSDFPRGFIPREGGAEVPAKPYGTKG